MKITKFEIEKLYGKYSFQSQLDASVNILVGNNGAFKSTVLDIIKYVVACGKKPELDFESAMVSFDNDMNMEVRPSTIPTQGADGKSLDNIKVSFISTFDIKTTHADTQRTLLDTQLEKLQSDYGYYLNGILKKFTNSLNVQGNVTKEDYNKIYSRKILFEELVNHAFQETGKTIDNDADKLRFIIGPGTTIGTDKLSSGEKQLLIILLTALLEDGEEYILMMDEPEISLHISWQYQLLNWILQLNPSAQLILTTHSPSIFSDGWGDKAIYMDDITTVAE